MSRPGLTPQEAMRLASDTADVFMQQAIRIVREITTNKFTSPRITDESILSRHPAIIAAMIEAAASNYSTGVLRQSVERLAHAIESASNHDKPF